MRVGQNPAKFVEGVARPERITVCLLCYVPALQGYYAQSLEVLKRCISSLLENTDLPHDLLVFDNGSCPEVREYLHQAHSGGSIQYLYLSERNLGKGGAWNLIFAGAPGEIVAYCDSDVGFRPGWLGGCLRVLEGFPNVGMVTGRPLRTKPELFGATLDWAGSEKEATIERGEFTPWDTILEFDLSLGQSESEIRRRFESTLDVKLTYRGVEALAGASHFQFVGYKHRLAGLGPLEMDRPMGQVRQLDERIDAAALLRLCTPEPYVDHLGNTLVGQAAGHRPHAARRSRLWDWSPVRRLLLKAYDRIFRTYFVEGG